MAILIFFLILAILVLIHEFGHFITAKKNGVLVEEFGFGFPPRLFAFKRGETTYSINLIPLGGFVKLYGEEYNELEKTVKGPLERAFVNKQSWQKALIIVAGVIGNFILGWVLISYLFTQGVPSPVDKVFVDQITRNSPAEKAGLQEKDTLIALVKDGKTYELKKTSDLIDLTKKFRGQKITLMVDRQSRRLSVEITPRLKTPAGEGPLGVAVTSFVEKKYPWYQAPFYGLAESFNITARIISELLKTVFQIVTLRLPKLEVSGPIAIYRYTGQAIKFGRNAVLELMALLSLNLAVVNILPFPALDGGRLVFVVYEWLTKKKVNQKLERYLNFAGFAFLIFLAVIISIHDIISK
ncbi:site-2 protease family protein [Candidatus Roizmanbacteria bacterium]|nr:site-2 protease family protein [Candidatus Roizmanbacteria bacterium]